jgi:hemerythrin-like metal-binding protein
MEKKLIIWSDAYSVNNAEIDKQHSKLIDLINRLYNAYLDKKHDEEIKIIIREIKEYTIYHFTTEEDLFKKHKYIESKAHSEMHKSFIDELNFLIQNYTNSPLVLTMKTMTFLQRWLTNHILKEDKKYMGII